MGSHSFIVPDHVVYNFRFIDIAIKDRPIYRPGRRSLGFSDICVLAKTADIIGLNKS